MRLRLSALLAATLIPLSIAHAALDPIKLAEDERRADAPALTTGASSRNFLIREKVAVAYGRILDPRGITPLLALAKDPNSSVARAALFALGQFGWSKTTAASREKEIADAIAPLLRSGDLSVKLAALEATGKLFHGDTQATLLPFLNDPTPAVRAQALFSLYQMRNAARMRGDTSLLVDLSDDAVARVAQLLNYDADEKVREYAAHLLFRLKEKRAKDAIRLATNDKKLWVRFFAVQAMGESSDPASAETFRALLRLVDDKSLLVRTEAVTAARKTSLIRKLTDQVYAKLARDPSAHVRTALVEAMRLENSIAIEKIEALAKDKSRMVRAKVIDALAFRKKDEALPQLRAALRDPDWWVRQQAVASATNLTEETREAFLADALRDSTPQVLQQTVQSLATLKTESARALVNANLKSPELSVRYASLASVASREEEPLKLELLWETYENSLTPKWNELRGGVVEVFAENVNEFTAAKLRLILNDPAPEVAYAAWKALQSRGLSDLPAMEAPRATRSSYAETLFTRNPKLTLTTTRGVFTIELFPRQAQIHVAHIVGYAERGGYDGLPWHRVVSNFVVQGGDPDGTGYGQGDYTVRAEVNPIRFGRGMVGMPRSSSWDSGGLQMFITHVPTLNLDGLYTVFGMVTYGLEVLDVLEPGDLILKATVAR